MHTNPLLRCTECGKVTQNQSGEIHRCPARPERGAVHQFEVMDP